MNVACEVSDLPPLLRPQIFGLAICIVSVLEWIFYWRPEAYLAFLVGTALVLAGVLRESHNSKRK